MTAVQLGMKSGNSLLDDDVLFGRIADRITREHPELGRVVAGQIVDQAVLFVAAAGRYPGMGLSPSDAVDIGWDAFILYTREYMDFCGRVAGRYVHHTPNDDPRGEQVAENGERIRTVAETADVLRQCGYWVLDELWPAESKAGCTACYHGTHQGKPPPSR